ncbi:MAG TPA: hypothetical protein VFD92_21260 [Candidatus Binatia bacterium]|nr:hypothetical protein [Candidatus Binatia bacterium]
MRLVATARWRRGAGIALALVPILGGAIAACGDRGSISPPVAAVPGTTVAFELDVDVSSPEHFYDLPFPSDLRLDATGRPDLAGFPAPSRNAIVASVRAAAARRPAFPVVGAAYFRFDGPLAPRAADDAIAAAPDAPALLIDVDPESDQRGRLFPLVASTLEEDAYAPPYLLAVAPHPGVVLRGRRTYAFVVRRALGDAAGAPLGVPLAIAQLAAGETPAGARGAAMRDLLAPLWETLDSVGVQREDVAAATVLTTADVVADLAALATAIAEREPADITDLRLDPDDGAAHQRFCELHGRIRLPQFQRGVPPFDTEGQFIDGDDGLPLVQREEVAPVAITLPRAPMPADGYPIAIYFHGSGGLSTQVVDRGRTAEPGGQPAKGEGPAHVLAAHGIATASSALPLNPERLPGAASHDYLNFLNLGSYPDTFRQATIEQRLLLDALSRLRIDPAALVGCAGPALPGGESAFRLRVETTLALGQSLGAQLANMVGAVEARVRAVVPTGSGGLWSLVPLEAELLEGVPIGGAIPKILGTNARVDHLHPGLQLVQAAFEAADPIVYAARLARSPLPGHPVRPLYIPAGVDDPGFSNRIYAAMALASGVPQAGEPYSPVFQEVLALGDLAGIVSYPAIDDARSDDGRRFTGAVVQYPADGVLDAHHVFAQRDDVKYQYGCFFATYLADGHGAIEPPRGLSAGCGG